MDMDTAPPAPGLACPKLFLLPDDVFELGSGQIYGSHAWELAPSSVGVKDFNTPEYKAGTRNNRKREKVCTAQSTFIGVPR